MTKLVQGGPVPVDRFEIDLGPGHLDIVQGRRVKGFVAAEPEIRLTGPQHHLDLGKDQPLGNRRRLMRFRRWPRVEPYTDTSRKRVAFHRSQRLQRETL